MKRKATTTLKRPAKRRRKTGVYSDYKYFASGPREKKFFDLTVSQTYPTAGVIIPSLNLLTAGTGATNILGKKCTVTSLQFNGVVTVPQINDDTFADLLDASFVRTIFYLDRQCNGAAATVADILASASPFAHLNLENSKRFKVLKDYRMSFSGGSLGTNASVGTTNAFLSTGENKTMVFYKRCNISLEFVSGAANNIANVKSNNIGILLIINDQTPGTVLNGISRIRFTDS